MKTRISMGVILLLTVAFALYFGVFNKDWTSSESEKASPDQIVIAQVGKFFLYLPLYFSVEGGYFEKEGLTAKIIDSGGDEKSVAAVISGDADIGVGDPTFAAIAGARGQETRVIASILNGVPFWGVTFRNDLPEIKAPADLKGLTVATFPAPSTAYTLQAKMFRSGGLDPSIRQAQFGNLLPTLKAGAADIALEIEPNVSIAVKNGAKVVYSLADIYSDFAMTGMTVKATLIAEEPDLVARIQRAVDAALKDAHSNPEKMTDFALGKFKDLPEDVVRNGVNRMLEKKVFPVGSAISRDAWNSAIQLRVDAGELPSVESAAKYLAAP